ncbi:hypothetical protein K7A41_23495 [Sphingobacterium sp. InxBP1]|uniref:hypothetical protein n=1 Tax=Sphingobacterium sp. InxBP1 TaxID=2870328 RepID=UPI002243BA6E|nr:hypothetical protein [Sphingobacterium sp. InxBP1]MCW8314210.1 hypothetical protein [Sphingobacterium sp. InxBP1]
MEKSLFIQWVQKFFPGIIVRTVETLNDTKNPLVYLHTSMLKPVFSVTGKWENLSASFSLVAADVVAMDSSLPLKTRDSMAQASGDIPKQGIELALNETELTQLDTLIANGATNGQVIAKLFADTPRAIGGIYERNEAIFLQGISTGLTVVDDPENVGVGVRCDYKYKTDHKFGVTVLWDNPATAKPLTDIKRVIDKAKKDGNTITTVMIDSETLNQIADSDQARSFFMAGNNTIVTDLSLVPPLDEDQVNALMKKRFGFTFLKVDRSIKVERDGKRSSIKPYAEGALVFLTSTKVGELVYAKLAEENHKQAGVEYQKANEYILVSKFRVTTPSLKEVTRAQARVVPVITAIDEIYLLDTKTVQA